MDNWLKVLKFKIYDRWGFTHLIFANVVVILGLLFLSNRYILGKNFQGLQDFLKKILLPSKENTAWAPEILLIAIFVLILLWVTVVIFPWIIDMWHAWQSPPSWDSNKSLCKDCFDDFIYDGNVSKNPQGEIRITNADAGVLLKNKYWKNFLIEFYFDFEDLRPVLEKGYLRNRDNIYRDIVYRPRSNYIGLLFRAQDLDNYFMLSIGLKEVLKENNKGKQNYDQEKKLLITPHIKVNGRWKIFTQCVVNSSFINEQGFNFVKCRVEGLKVMLDLYKDIEYKRSSFNFVWNLPSNFVPTYTDPNQVKERKEEYSYGDSSKITFLKAFGMVGFRAYGDEHVVIKDIVITKLC